MNKKIYIFIGIAVTLSIIGIAGNALLERIQEEELARYPAVSSESAVSLKKDKEYALSLLPKELALYKIIENGYNPDGSLFSISVYFPDNTYQMRNTIEMDYRKNGYLGSWIINLRDDTAKRLASASQDYNFSRWVNSERIELLSESNATATIYDAISGDAVSQRSFNLDTTADISGWDTYRSEKYGFEVKYPAGMTVKETDRSEVSDSVVNRYVSFLDAKNGLNIHIGLKRASEESVMPRPYRTGISAGDFLSRGVVSFGAGSAREIQLVNCYFPGENRCAIEMIWFCGTDNGEDSLNG